MWNLRIKLCHWPHDHLIKQKVFRFEFKLFWFLNPCSLAVRIVHQHMPDLVSQAKKLHGCIAATVAGAREIHTLCFDSLLESTPVFFHFLKITETWWEMPSFYSPCKMHQRAVFTKTFHFISLLLLPLSAPVLQASLVLVAWRKEPFKKIKWNIWKEI